MHVPHHAPTMIGGPSRFDRVKGLREVLTATGAGLYLVTHVAGPVPAETMTAVHESDEMELRVGRVGPGRADDIEQRDKEARAVAAAALRTSPEHIVLMHGAADAAAAITLDVLGQRRASDARVVLLDGVDPVTTAAVAAVAVATGASLDVLPAIPQILAADVALVLVGHVSADGTCADVPSIAEVAHKAGARLLVDASLSVGALDFGVDDLAADAVIADSHHWLLGPEAVAIAWLGPGLGVDLPQRLRDATTPLGRGALLGLARSVGWLLMYVELPWAIARTEELAERLYAGLADIDGIEVVGDPEAHGAIAAFRISDWDAEQAAEELSRSIFAMVEADVEADLVRASVGAWNRESELDKFLERVSDLGTHTPETLPRRPSLTVISGPLDPADQR